MTSWASYSGHLSFSKYGKGDSVLIAFHGFGQDKSFFRSWGKVLSSKYTLYAIDLFYHGESKRRSQTLTKNEWKAHFADFIKSENLSRFSILGYSLGGRFAIVSALLFKNKVDNLILIAPDAVFHTIWFKMATTPVIRNIFKYLMHNPDKLDSWISFGERNRIIGKYIVDFVRKEMGTAENREKVYLSWNHFKPLGFSHKELINQFQNTRFQRKILLGSKDYIIKPDDILPIIERLGGFDVRIFDKKHHQLLDLEVARSLIKSS